MNVKVTIELEIEDLDNREDLEEYLCFEFGGNSCMSTGNVYLNSGNNYDVKNIDIEIE